MLFDRFSFRERESGLQEDEPVVADLPSEGRSYAFSLDTRQMVLLIAGYCFLCVLVFALGIVVGRATTPSATVAETGKSEPYQPPEPPTNARAGLSTSNRIPLIPAAEPKSPMPQGPEFAFAPTPAEPPPAIKPENLPAVSSRPKPAPAPETSLNPEPPAPAPKIEDRHEPEPRRPAATIDSKPQVTTSTRTAPNQGGDYTIQVSSFRNMEQASELKGRLSKKGYAVYVQSVDLTDKGTWYRVRVGTYRDKGGAERVASDLRSRESLPATVMKR